MAPYLLKVLRCGELIFPTKNVHDILYCRIKKQYYQDDVIIALYSYIPDVRQVTFRINSAFVFDFVILSNTYVYTLYTSSHNKFEFNRKQAIVGAIRDSRRIFNRAPQPALLFYFLLRRGWIFD